MNAEKRPVLFVSYNNRDKKLVEQLVEALKDFAIDVRFDENLIEDGSNWREKLEMGLAKADGVLMLLTPNSINSAFVISELGAARVYAKDPVKPKLLLPVLFGQ